MYRDVDEGVWGGRGVDCFEKHGAMILVEEFRRAVDVIVCSGVWTTDDHDGEAGGRRV